MLTYSFANTGSEPLYLHLYKCIKNDILDGVLLSGTKLPSKRSFAKNLGISNITVENAYAQLQAEGFIYSIPKKGFYIFQAIKYLKRACIDFQLPNILLLSSLHHFYLYFPFHTLII